MLAGAWQRAGPRQNRVGNARRGKFRIYKGSTGWIFGRPPSSARGFDLGTDQMEFSAIEQFPLNGFTWLDADGGGEGQRKADVETRLLALGTAGLNFDGISGLHFFWSLCIFLLSSQSWSIL